VVLGIENLAVVRLTIAEQKHDVFVKDYRNQRVVTLREVDTLHGRVEGTARRNFNDNRKHFIEGEDFFVRNSYEAKTEFGITAPNGLTLLTESGYLMLVKSFTDDLAWQVQRQLVKHYFRGKVSPKRNSLPYLDQLGKALREDAKLSKGLSLPNQLRSRAEALIKLQDQTGVDYSQQINMLFADADAQEAKQKETVIKAEQETKALANTPTGQASQALEWLRIEYTKQGEKLAHVHEDWLLVRSDLWKMWAGKHKLNLTMICRELHNQGIVEKHSESGRERYGIGKRINGKAYTFIWLKKDKLDWLTGTESQTN